MSDRGDVVEWVETTEEVIIIEECLLPDSNSSSVSEPTETPIQKLLDTMVQGEDAEFDNGFCCEECHSLFQDQSDLIGMSGPSFILDSPTNMGVPQRALLTLPHGLMIGRSSIPNAGLGVMNQGPAVSPGMHFGPYEGEVTTRENAMASNYSWEIHNGKDVYDYIDAARDSHSNWMRYVNCARNEMENNLLAVQYKGSVLFHCCRTIHPGDELVVWPSSNLLSHLSEAWTQIWFMKLTPTESNTSIASQIFLCPNCPLSFTTETYLQRHVAHFHLHPKEASEMDGNATVEPEHPSAGEGTQHSAASMVVLSVDTIGAKTCSECGKIFKHTHHLKRHMLSVHSNKRPYCCPQCRRSFSQASGLLRHQMVHKKQALTEKSDTPTIQNQSDFEETEMVSSLQSSKPTDSGEELPKKEETAVTEHASEREVNSPEEAVGTGEDATEKRSKTCTKCEKSFANEGYLKKHKLTVHGNLRPYVCTLCRKSFGQYSDLARHLTSHQVKLKKETGVNQATVEKRPSVCPAPVEEPEESSASADDCQDLRDPDFVAQPSVTKRAEHTKQPPYQRPQRLAARSKISAITKLIAPKRRVPTSKRTLQSSMHNKKINESREGEDFDASTQTGTGRTSDNGSCSQEDLTEHGCPTGAHKCTQCDATFKKSGFLKRHERKMHDDTKVFTCSVCGKIFGKLCHLKQHQKLKKCEKHYYTSELFLCPYCQFSFTIRSYLRKHIRRHHPVEYLSYSYSESDGQTGQPENEEDKVAHVCPHCGKTYASAKHFKAHACFQQVRVLYLCTDCGKGFTNHYSLKQHQRIHTGEKPYSCPHCAKSFSYTGQLKVHLRTHTGEKPYLCTHCGESFRQSGDLKRHERKHTGVRPYSCPDCFKTFSRLQSLKAHQMLHLGQKMFKCTQCGKSFSRNYHLRRHHQKMHS